MSNITLFDNSNIPAHLRAVEPDAMTKALMGGSGSMRRISIKGNVWRLLEGGKEIAQREERYLNVVIVAAASHVSRTFYSGAYEEGAKVAPACWSADGIKPDAGVAAPQHSTCNNCPMNIKGSGQGDSRACRFSQRLAVVLDNDIEGDVYQITLPATSIFGAGEAGKWPLQAYARQVGSRGVPISGIVTEMRFDTSSPTPKVVFKPVRFLEANELDAAIKQGASDAAQRAIAMTVTQADGIRDTPAPTKTAPAEDDVLGNVGGTPAKASVATVVDEQDDDPVQEPVRRVTKKEAAAPVAKTDLSAVLDAWDD